MIILVIDPDADFRLTFCAALSGKGHLLNNCDGTTCDLELLEPRPHLALVADGKGPGYAPAYQPARWIDWLRQHSIPCVITTLDWPPEPWEYDWVREGKCLGVVPKSLPRDDLLGCLRRFELDHRFPSTAVRFRLTAFSVGDEKRGKEGTGWVSAQPWAEVRDQIDDVDDWDPVADEAEFRLLFRSLVSPCALEVELAPTRKGRSGAALVRAFVYSGDGPVRESLAVKYGRKQLIVDEALRYDRHVGPLPDGAAAQLRWRAETTNLAAIAYSWVGDSVLDGDPLGPPSSGHEEPGTWARRRRTVSRLFAIALDSWYRVYRQGGTSLSSEITLAEYYRAPGGPWGRQIQSFQQLLPDITVWAQTLPAPVGLGPERWEFNHRRALPNPVRWADEAGRQVIGALAPCHGDLHVRNIYMLPDDSPRLIDFGRTDLGHVYRDFAALETSLRLICVDAHPFLRLAKLEQAVTAARSLGDYIDYRAFDDAEEFDLREVAHATMDIRRAALDASGSSRANSLYEYLYAVVVHMLRYASMQPDEIRGAAPDGGLTEQQTAEHRPRVWHALYGAALATEKAIGLGPEAAVAPAQN